MTPGRCLTIAFTAALLATSSRARADGDEEKLACVAAHAEGQRLRHAGKLLAARAKFLACAAATCPALVQKDCTSWLAEVEGDVPTVVVASDAAAGAELFVDGRRQEHGLDGRAQELDPGAHRLRVGLPDGKSTEREVMVHEGEKNRRVEIPLAPGDASARPDLAPLSRPLPVGFFVGSAFAVVGAGMAAGFGAAALSATSCKPNCSLDQVSTVHRDGAISDVALGVAIAGAAVAVIFFATRPTRAEKAGARVAPRIGRLTLTF